MKPFFLIWTALSLAVFAVLASVPQHIYAATGANSYTRSGWPGGWLSRYEYKTYVSRGAGPPQVDECRVHYQISDRAFLACAVSVSITLPGFVLLAVKYGLKKRTAVPTSRSTE
jgi:hypothetical protein